MAQLTSDLVGRVPELEEFERTLGRLRHGYGAALAVVGEPGIGKIRLLAEFVARTGPRETVLTGSASEYERGLPFGPFIDALDEHVERLDPHHLAPLDDEDVAQLGHILPSRRLRPPPPGPLTQDERHRAHRAVRVLLDRLAAARPLVLILDDVHWSDSASIELLAALLRRPPAAAVLIAVAARPRQTPEVLLGTMERAARRGDLIRLDLGALTLAEAGRLIGRPIDGPSAWLYATSGGNPFYLEQLARVPQPALPPRAAEAAPADFELPAAVAAALGEELSLLPRDVRLALDGAAIAGDPFEPELVAAAADRPLPLVLATLDDLLRRDLIRATEVPRRFRFRHPLVRRAVYEAAPAAWRLGAHERCAEAFAARGAPLAVVAGHVEQGGRPGDAKAIAVLTEAGRLARQRAPAEAARMYAAALRLLSRTCRDEDRLGLLAALAQAQKAAGRFAAAHDTLRQILDLTAGTPTGTRIEIIAACAELEQVLGLHAQAHDRLRTTLDRLPGEPSPAAVLLTTQLAIEGLYDLDYRSMGDWARRARATARQLDDRPVHVATASLLAMAAALDGAIEEARSAADEAAAIADALPDDELARCPDHFANLAPAELYLDRHRRAATHAERAWRIARATGRDRVVPVLFWVGTVWTGCGRLLEASEILDVAAEVARLSHHSQGVAWNLAVRSLVATAAGDTESALAAAEEAVDASRGSDRRLPAVLSGLALAAALLPAGEPGRAGRVLLTAAGGDGPIRLPVRWRPWAYELLTRCQLALGHPEEAAATAQRAQLCASELGLPTALATADRAAAAAALESGEASTAERLAASAVERFASAGAVVDEAVARILLAAAQSQSGYSKAAADELDRAVAALAAAGADRLRDQAERRLRQLRPRTSDGASGGRTATLTVRELEVARLMAHGRTNREIAAEMFLSRKTVETHLHHVFHKLGVTTRVRRPASSTPRPTTSGQGRRPRIQEA